MPCWSFDAGNPEGQKLLTEWIGHLRQTHVEFTHLAHHDLMHVSFLPFASGSLLLVVCLANMEPSVTDTLMKSACEIYNPYQRTACGLGKSHHVMQVRMLFSLDEAVQLAPNFLQDAPCA